MAGRRAAVVVTVAAVVAGGVGLAAYEIRQQPLTPPTCLVGRGELALQLDPEQAANAATVAAVAHQRGLPDHAVTVALAAAFQESKLRNLGYGDRDSVGLFQQRPSQGWGSPQQLIHPTYAAGAFFDHLTRVARWRSLPVADAAQEVQHSADGSAYAQWEEPARDVARAVTGEQPAALACQDSADVAGRSGELTRTADAELGSGWAQATGRRGWAVATWLVAHASRFGVTDVSVGGHRWTLHDGRWRSDTQVGPGVRFTVARGAAQSASG